MLHTLGSKRSHPYTSLCCVDFKLFVVRSMVSTPIFELNCGVRCVNILNQSIFVIGIQLRDLVRNRADLKLFNKFIKTLWYQIECKLIHWSQKLIANSSFLHLDRKLDCKVTTLSTCSSTWIYQTLIINLNINLTNKSNHQIWTSTWISNLDHQS